MRYLMTFRQLQRLFWVKWRRYYSKVKNKKHNGRMRPWAIISTDLAICYLMTVCQVQNHVPIREMAK
jgi:hypothetical protein